MPKVIPVGEYEADIRYRNQFDAEDYHLVFGFRAVEPIGPTTLLDGISGFCDEIAGDNWSEVYSFTGATVTFQESETEQELTELAFTSAGTDPDPVDKQNVAILMRKFTALGGQSGKGRMYISGILNNASTDAGVLTAPTLAIWVLKGFSALEAFESFDLKMTLLHDVDEDHDLFGTSTDVNTLIPSTVLATQRRRLRRPS